MRRLAPDLMIDSAGTGRWHVGAPPYGPMIAAGHARGYDLTPLRARQITRLDFARFDRIIVMDAANLADVEALRPEASATPVTRLLDHVAAVGAADVPDPYYTGDFDGALDLIEAGCNGLLRALDPD